MADGAPPGRRADGAEPPPLADEARLLKRTRWRLVAWSGISTLLVLLLLAVALYAAVARTLESASVAQLDARVDPLVSFLEGDQRGPGDGPDRGGLVLGGGNTFLYLFDEQGHNIRLGPGGQVAPAGLPVNAGIAAAKVSPDGQAVRTSTLQIQAANQSATVPIRIMTERVTAQADNNQYFVQALVDRTTEVPTLNALLARLAIGGVLVVIVAFGFGTLYARRALVPIRQSLEAQRLALRRRGECAADGSHELRTPLTVIRSSVE